jgi:hypothetical protein
MILMRRKRTMAIQNEEMSAELGALVELGQFDLDIDAESTMCFQRTW